MNTHTLKSFLITRGHVCYTNKPVHHESVSQSPARSVHTLRNTTSACSSGSSSKHTPGDFTDQNRQLQPAEAYLRLPASFWDERRILYNRMRHERDRANRRARLKQLRELEEAQLSQMGPDARATYESEMTALRIAAAKQQQQVLADALQHGLKVVIDCSYCFSKNSMKLQSSSLNTSEKSQQHQEHNDSLHQPQHRTQQASSACKLSEGQLAVTASADTTSGYAVSTDPAGSASSAHESASNNGNIQEQVTSWQRDGTRSSHEVRSLAKQIELAVSLNRRSSQPVALTVTSFTGNIKTFALHMGAHSWPLNKHAEHVLDLLPAEHIVLLSPDADTPLLELQPDKAYVIGGIVDRSICKGLTAEFGARHGLELVRLPVLEFAEQLGLNFPGAKKRPVLNVSDVVVALVEYHRTGDWVHALKQALPSRKRRGGAAAGRAAVYKRTAAE